ncbi:uncharacterized protein LOC135815413 [Sycon ciliatum]|uniref:uncharacterized protein LOC135815413 n=1 Tax=Sycon ciliatum TaxID=27933 RepID=UPI0031F68BE0|eukprot:scpid30523/ scgid3810/ 
MLPLPTPSRAQAGVVVTVVVCLMAAFVPGCNGQSCTAQSADQCCILPTGDVRVGNFTYFPVAITTLTKVRACLRSLDRLPQSLRDEVVESLRLKLTNLYAFVDLARNSTAATPCPGVKYSVHKLEYDALPALDVARRQASPVDFFQTLSAAFRGFNDAHTRFFSPLQAFHYVRPMVLTTRLVTPQPGATPEQQVFFSKVNPLYSLLNATQVLAVTVSWKDFVGRRVYRINGVDALTYLKTQADRFGFHKSRGVRFNQLLKQTYFSLGEHDLPGQDTEVYTLQDGAEVIATLVAVVTDPRLTSSGVQQVSRYISSRQNSVINAIKLSNLLDTALAYQTARTLSSQIPTWDLKPLSISFEDVIVAFEVDKALVLKLPGEFGISPSNAQLLYRARYLFLEATKLAKERGIDTILFDVIGDNGGQLQLTNWLLGALVPEYQTSDAARCVTYDMKASAVWDRWLESFASQRWVRAVTQNLTYEQVEELLEMVVTRESEFAEMFDPSLSIFYLGVVQPHLIFPLKKAMGISDPDTQLKEVRTALTNLLTRSPYSYNNRYYEWYPMTQRNRPSGSNYENLAYYRQPVQYLRGGTVSNYSQRFYESCFTTVPATEKEHLWTAVQTYFRNILFLTDGTCGGACALLLSKLQLDGRAKVTTLGGVYNEPMDTSFTGGFVEDWPEELEKIRLSEFLGKIIFRANTTFPELDRLPVPATVTQHATCSVRVFYFFEVVIKMCKYDHQRGHGLSVLQIRLSEFLGKIIFRANTTFPELDRLPVPATFTLTTFEMYVASLGECALPRDWYNIPGDYHVDLWATQLDDWPTPDHAQLRDLYRQVIAAQAVTPAPTMGPTTPPEKGLSGGALTGILIACSIVGVALLIVGYVHLRKCQRKPLLPNSETSIQSQPMLDDTVSVSGQDLWQEEA